jgi:glycosyltransferase involved in cell wall biosynthesis
LIVDELLRQGVEVAIATCEHPQPARSDLLPTTAHILNTTADFDAVAAGYDHILYNIGNHAPYHARLPAMLRSHPGILIFHDWYVYDLFYGTLAAEGQLAAHDTVVRRLYGMDAPLTGLETMSAQDVMLHRSRNFPMTEWLAPYGTAAIAHSTYCLEKLRQACGGPVRAIPLAYKGPDVPPAAPAGNGPIRVATFGHVNPNKRVDFVIRAIANTPALRDRCLYRVVGSIADDDRARLDALALDLGYRGLTFTGEASQADFDRELAATDIVCCLRYPTLESASATAIEAMQSGRAALVTNAGFYRDLPDDLVFKIDPEHEMRDIAATLERLVADEPLRLDTGSRARKWAAQRFSARAYVDDLLAFLPQTRQGAPLYALGSDLVADITHMNLPPEDPLVDRLVQTARKLFQDG